MLKTRLTPSARSSVSVRGASLALTLVAALGAAACAPGYSVSSSAYSVASKQVDGGGSVTEPLPAAPAPSVPPAAGTPAPTQTALPFCSSLSFAGVVWDSKLSVWARRSLSISLSLSGSFEGGSGWRNLTNNFDGMGLSAGLLNQTLGTNSLQPLLAQLRADHPEVYTQVFQSTRRTSILKMITDWEATTGFEAAQLAKTSYSASADYVSLLDVYEANRVSSPLDRDDFASAPEGSSQKLSATEASVQWAVANLYDSTDRFYPGWKAELSSLMGHPHYVSLQIRAAQALHTKAVGYMNRVRIRDLRTYLLMFDVAVQNGGINESEFGEWDGIVAARPSMTIEERLKALIEIRLLRVRDEYVSDVRSRKFAIITGKGAVHGTNRDLPKQYCYSNTDRVL